MFFPSYTVVKLLQFVSRLFAIEVVVCVGGGGVFLFRLLKIIQICPNFLHSTQITDRHVHIHDLILQNKQTFEHLKHTNFLH